jgi:hypothetical protein
MTIDLTGIIKMKTSIAVTVFLLVTISFAEQPCRCTDLRHGFDLSVGFSEFTSDLFSEEKVTPLLSGIDLKLGYTLPKIIQKTSVILHVSKPFLSLPKSFNESQYSNNWYLNGPNPLDTVWEEVDSLARLTGITKFSQSPIFLTGLSIQITNSNVSVSCGYVFQMVRYLYVDSGTIDYYKNSIGVPEKYGSSSEYDHSHNNVSVNHGISFSASYQIHKVELGTMLLLSDYSQAGFFINYHIFSPKRRG